MTPHCCWSSWQDGRDEAKSGLRHADRNARGPADEAAGPRDEVEAVPRRPSSVLTRRGAKPRRRLMGGRRRSCETPYPMPVVFDKAGWASSSILLSWPPAREVDPVTSMPVMVNTLTLYTPRQPVDGFR